MKSHFLGFSIDFESENINFDKFIRSLSKSLSHNIGSEKTPENRKIYFDSKSNSEFYTGMIITIRDQKKFCQGNTSDDDFTFDIVDLKKAHKIFEFNYFIIDKKTKLGLYQYYHNSCTARSLGKYLQRLFNQYRFNIIQDHITKEIIKNNNKELSKSQETKIRKQYKATLDFSILIQQNKMEEILSQYKKIKAFEYQYTYLSLDVKKATPLSSFVRKKKEILVFEDPSLVNQLISPITDFLKTNDLDSGRLKVENDKGDDIFLKIFDMPDYFATYEFDELADQLKNIKASKFYTSNIIELLLTCYKNPIYDHIFQVDIA